MKKLCVCALFIHLTFTYATPISVFYSYGNGSPQDEHPYQIIIIPVAEVDPVTLKLSEQGQQRAAYLVNFLQDQTLPTNYGGPFFSSFASSSILDFQNHRTVVFYVPQAGGTPPAPNNFDPDQAIQTILPLYHLANTFSVQAKHYTIESKSGDGLQAPVVYNNSADLFDVFLYNSKGASLNNKTVIICWERSTIQNLFDKQLTNIGKILKDLIPAGNNIYDRVWVIRWDANNTPHGYTINLVTDNTFNKP